ncbi:Uncharacterised protein [Bordetella pertussis]|nr:Uncharacterised protein [Bordetella pertussis]
MAGDAVASLAAPPRCVWPVWQTRRFFRPPSPQLPLPADNIPGPRAHWLSHRVDNARSGYR